MNKPKIVETRFLEQFRDKFMPKSGLAQGYGLNWKQYDRRLETELASRLQAAEYEIETPMS